MLQFRYEKEDGIRITLALPENVDEYAKNLLVLFNTMRENKEDFLKLENDSGNYVFVTVAKESIEQAKKFLGWYGEIIEEETVNIFHLVPYYDRAGFNVLYEDRDGEPIEPVAVVDLSY